jgi:RNA polymerase sigma-70 factor (ECF subfamily)
MTPDRSTKLFEPIGEHRSVAIADETTQQRAEIQETDAGEAFERYHRHIYRFLLRRTGSHHDADEIAQRVFAEAAECLATTKTQPRSVLAFLYTIAERRFIDEIRRRSTAREGLSRLGASPGPDYEYGREVGAALTLAIAKLPDEQRAVVVMKVLQGRTFAEIADRLGVSVDACKMRLSRAVKQLRVDLARSGVSPGA